MNQGDEQCRYELQRQLQRLEGYYWLDPVGKQHYRLRTHHLKSLVRFIEGHDLESHSDVPDEIQEQLHAEEQQWLERQERAAKNPIISSTCPLININVNPTQFPQPSMMAIPAGTSATL